MPYKSDHCLHVKIQILHPGKFKSFFLKDSVYQMFGILLIFHQLMNTMFQEKWV